MRRNNLDTLIRDTYIGFNKELDIYDNLEIPDFNDVMDKFYNNVNKEKSSPSLGKKLGMIASFTIVILFSAVLSAIPQVDAFKFHMVRTVEEIRENIKYIKFSTGGHLEGNLVSKPKENEVNKNKPSTINSKREQIEKLGTIEEIQKVVPFNILLPKHLPNEYKLDGIKLLEAVGNLFRVRQTYVSNEEYYIYITQTTTLDNTEGTFSISTQFEREYLNIDNLRVILYTDDKSFKKMLWFKNNIKFEMKVPYNITDNEIRKIITSLE